MKRDLISCDQCKTDDYSAVIRWISVWNCRISKEGNAVKEAGGMFCSRVCVIKYFEKVLK